MKCKKVSIRDGERLALAVVRSDLYRLVQKKGTVLLRWLQPGRNFLAT